MRSKNLLLKKIHLLLLKTLEEFIVANQLLLEFFCDDPYSGTIFFYVYFIKDHFRLFDQNSKN